MLEPPWDKKKGTLNARGHLERVLTENARLPLAFWRKRFLFFGAPDRELHRLTAGAFSPQVDAWKTHPLYCLQTSPHGIGAQVCPCSSSRPFKVSSFRFIRKGCRLLHTGFVMDRNSHLIENLAFPLPRSLAHQVSFKGEVPEECLLTVSRFRPATEEPESGFTISGT